MTAGQDVGVVVAVCVSSPGIFQLKNLQFRAKYQVQLASIDRKSFFNTSFIISNRKRAREIISRTVRISLFLSRSTLWCVKRESEDYRRTEL